ncbi:MAG: cobyrinic acid a,c-diamide synthase [Comamonadaceae bacterium CG_4_9_14_3_um_filter_60_33]|nr:MAG: cobyrinic acid a,c-diamide synthase [Comamonadaceae bacterium CG2_30_59_20]PIY27945.1 MAG: cobyrinic acid a,c-diamide synthase [Comamonadaceae bacterium CG_4_10_14_3_um_filter_60_42]PJB40894.1 MAG: cobyrinic acid a,c-diamide synthase [Comamonadaceae bacterium CG_4_9_14_3_um_filter_60_33]
MPLIVVANPKGGVGKSTLSTQIAGYFASQNHAVMLGDADRQQSSKLWLSLRPEQARAIRSWDLGDDGIAKPPKGTTHVVLDTPAGLHGKRLKEILKRAHKVIVPLQPSVFDIFATQDFLNELADNAQAAKIDIGIVGMRVDERTRAAEQLRTFVEATGLPVLGYVRNTQNYVQLAARGLTVFDLPPGRVARDLAQWQAICRWLDK